MVVPTHIPRGIGAKRQYIKDNAHDQHIVMLDDDLVFAQRRKDDPTKFTSMVGMDFDNMFGTMEDVMAGYLHGGMSGREGANRCTDEYRLNNRAMRVLMYDRAAPFEFVNRNMQDFTATLDLLVQGHPNILLNNWVSNQKGSNSAGGCSITRTAEVHSSAAHALQRRYPNFVTVVQKHSKKSWGGGSRTDVRVQWKKAYDWGVSHRVA